REPVTEVLNSLASLFVILGREMRHEAILSAHASVFLHIVEYDTPECWPRPHLLRETKEEQQGIGCEFCCSRAPRAAPYMPSCCYGRWITPSTGSHPPRRGMRRSPSTATTSW